MSIKDLTFDDLPGKPQGLAGLSFDDIPGAPQEGAGQAALIGSGRMLDRLYKGVKQAALQMNSVPGLGAAAMPGLSAILQQGDEARQQLDSMAVEEGRNTAQYGKLQKERPIATMLGEAAPLMVLPMGSGIRGAMAVGAVPGIVEYGTPEEKAIRAGAGAVGGGAGYGIGKGIGKVISPGAAPATDEAARLASVAAKEGIPLDAAQVTGNQVLQNTKAALSRIPWTATGQQAKEAERQAAFNSAVLKRLGSGGKAATPDVLADAYAATTQKMESAANSVALTLDDRFVEKLAAVEKTYLRRLPTDQKPVIQSYLDDLTELIGKEGALPGDVYSKTRSELGRIAFETKNSTVREGAKGMQKALDDAFDRQAPPQAVKAMKEARSEYAKYMTTSSAVKKGRSVSGDIPPKQLYAQAQQDIPGFERGQGGDFADLVRSGRMFLPDPVPNSGTPERLLYQNLLTAGTMSGLGALGGLAADDKATGVPTGALLGLGGFGLSKAAQAALNSPQLTRYLMNKVLEEEQKRLLAQGGGLLGLAGASALAP